MKNKLLLIVGIVFLISISFACSANAMDVVMANYNNTVLESGRTSVGDVVGTEWGAFISIKNSTDLTIGNATIETFMNKMVVAGNAFTLACISEAEQAGIHNATFEWIACGTNDTLLSDTALTNFTLNVTSFTLTANTYYAIVFIPSLDDSSRFTLGWDDVQASTWAYDFYTFMGAYMAPNSYSDVSANNPYFVLYGDLAVIDPDPPVLSNYNMTSESGDGCTIWNTDQTRECNTTDSTPTVTFNSSENAWCAISTGNGAGDVNYSDMGNTRNCTGGEGAIEHTCTVIAGDALSLGAGNVYIGCKDSTGNENLTTSSSGALAINFQGVTVNLISPADAIASNDTNQTFKCNATSSTNLTDITFYIWNNTAEYYSNTTIIVGTANETNWTISLPGNDYNWNCFANNDIPLSAWGAANYSLTINSYFNVSLVSPADNLITINTTLNFTAQLNLLNYNITNSSLYVWYPNGTLFNTNFTTLIGDTTVNVSRIISGLIMFENYTWNYYACAIKNVSNHIECDWDINRTFSVITTIDANNWDNYTYETDTSTFQINITLPEGATLYGAKFDYNNTNYTVTDVSRTGSFYSLTKTIDIPVISNYSRNTSVLRDFSWHFTYAGTIGFSNETTDSNQQNVTAITFVLCNLSYYDSAINFTIRKEEAPHDKIEGLIPTVNNTWAAAWKYWLGSGSVYKTFNIFNTSTNESEIDFCIYPINLSYYADLEMEYASDGYISRKYYLDDAVLTNDTTSVNLYLLDEDEAVKFFINLKRGYENVVNAFVTIAKYVVGDGTYLTIGKRESDSDGNFIEYLDLDKTYQFAVVKDNSILGILTEVSKCEEAPCKIYLSLEEAVIDVWEEYYNIYGRNVVYNLTYNATSKIVTYIYVDVTGLAEYGRLQVDLIRYNATYETVCNTNTYSAVGTLTCNLSAYDDGQFKATAYISRSPELIVDVLGIMLAKLAMVLGEHGLLIALFFIITVSLVGFYNPAVGIILALVALFVSALAGFVLLSFTALMFIITIGIIMIIKMRT